MDDWQKRRLIRAFLHYWLPKLVWHTWEVRWKTGKKIVGSDSPPPYGDAECFPDFDEKRATLYFNLKRMTSEEKIERSVIHELCHLLIREETPEQHQMIRRLERIIRGIRIHGTDV